MEKKSLIEKVDIKILIIIFLFVVVFVVVLMLSFVFRRQPENIPNNSLTPTPVAAQIPQDVEIPTPHIKPPETVFINRLGEVSFSFSQQNFPSKATLYTYSPAPISRESAEQISKRMGIMSRGKEFQSNIGSAIGFQEGLKNATFYLDSGYLEYIGETSGTARTVSNINQVITLAQNAINATSPYSQGLRVNEQEILFFTGLGDITSTDEFSSADIYDVPYYQLLDGLPVYLQLGGNARAHVWINKSGEIQRITLNTSDALTSRREESILNQTEAREKILDGKGTIVKYGKDFNSPLPTLTRTVFSSMELGYLKDSESKIIYPMYIFKGEAFTATTVEPITVYLPASTTLEV